MSKFVLELILVFLDKYFGISLKEISVTNNDLEIKGVADHIDGLEVINLFMLESNNSLFLRKGSDNIYKNSQKGIQIQKNNKQFKKIKTNFQT